MLEDPNKLSRSWFEGHNHKKIDWKDAAESFAQHIQRIAIEALPAEANPLDIEIFKQGIGRLHESFDGIANALNASQSNRTDEAFMHIRCLMAAVFILGQSAVMSPKMKKVWLSEFQSKSGKVSAKKNQEEAVDRQGSVLASAIELRAKNKSLTQGDLATKLIEKWDEIDFRGHKPAPNNHAYLVKLISKWERAGKLTNS
jgi:hypothetical protein